jgi:primosomal protein N' (replication factor Y)
VREALAAGRQTLIVAPTERDVRRIVSWVEAGGVFAWRSPAPTRAVDGLDGAGAFGGSEDPRAADRPVFRPSVARLVAEDGAGARTEAFWGTASGAVDVLVGTRAAAYVPMARPGLTVLVGDGESALDEPRAPYAGARAVLAVRSAQERTPLLFAGLARTVPAQALVEAGWMVSVTPPRALVRAVTPLISAPTAEDLAREGPTARTRLPSAAFQVIRDALGAGPVLVQAPSAEHEVFGLARTSAELGRAFPGVGVKRSAARPGILDEAGENAELVVATPGAEPPAVGGYAAAVLLDAGALTARPGIDASADALRVWMNAAALVRPSGRVLVVGTGSTDGSGVAAQALLRWDPAGLAARELAERRELGLPPATKAIVLVGASGDVSDLLARAALPGGTRVAPGEAKTVVLLQLSDARAGVAALRAAVRARSIANRGGPVRVKVDGELD